MFWEGSTSLEYWTRRQSHTPTAPGNKPFWCLGVWCKFGCLDMLRLGLLIVSRAASIAKIIAVIASTLDVQNSPIFGLYCFSSSEKSSRDFGIGSKMARLEKIPLVPSFSPAFQNLILLVLVLVSYYDYVPKSLHRWVTSSDK